MGDLEALGSTTGSVGSKPTLEFVEDSESSTLAGARTGTGVGAGLLMAVAGDQILDQKAVHLVHVGHRPWPGAYYVVAIDAQKNLYIFTSSLLLPCTQFGPE
jgi:hypothetical protein